MAAGEFYTETMLVEQFRQGNEDAFNVVFSRYSQRVFLFAKRYVSQVAEAEDITSEAFIKLWDRRTQFDSLAAILAFLHTSAKNRCLDCLRHENMRNRRHRQLIGLLQTSANGDFSSELILAELLRLLYSEAEKLPPRMREIFFLTYREGLKPAQIAQQLSLNVQTVKNQRVNAVRLLKTAMKEDVFLLSMAVCLEVCGIV